MRHRIIALMLLAVMAVGSPMSALAAAPEAVEAEAGDADVGEEQMTAEPSEAETDPVSADIA